MNCHHFNRIRISDNEFISTTCSPAAATRREPDHAVSRSKSRFLPASPGVIHREKGRPKARCEKVFDPTEAIFSRSEPPFAVSPAQDKRALQIVVVAKQIVPRAGTRQPQARQAVLRKNKKAIRRGWLSGNQPSAWVNRFAATRLRARLGIRPVALRRLRRQRRSRRRAESRPAISLP